MQDVWAGRVRARYVLALAEQLHLNPYSRVRMIALGGDPRWIGWDAAADASAAVHDVILAVASGIGGSSPQPSDFYPRPGRESPSADPELFAPSIADFSVGAFMKQINS